MIVAGALHLRAVNLFHYFVAVICSVFNLYSVTRKQKSHCDDHFIWLQLTFTNLNPARKLKELVFICNKRAVLRILLVGV